MDQMTNDVIDLDVELTPDDSISIYGQEGEYYGWVDYVRFDKIGDITTSEDTAEETTTTEVPKTGETFPVYTAAMLMLSLAGVIVTKTVYKAKRANR